MVGMNRWRTIAKTLLALVLVVALIMGVEGAGSAAYAALKGRSRIADPSQSAIKSSGKIAEASPPSALQELGQALEGYQPQVTILSPRKNEVLPDNTVAVRFLVKDLPIFKNETFGLGPHLHVLLDNHAYQAVYDLSKPLVFNDLEPGTHTIRAFASRPWHESFKNEGAFAQTTFHVLTKTQDNSPDPDLPLLTYSRPQGVYGAEPILLDFYLTNAPLHLVAQADEQDDIADWRIRCTVNGDRFILDRWQPIYLKGFRPGKNWVQLEYLDEKGNPVKNEFNNTVRLVDYQPNGEDTLAKLVRGDLAAADVQGIVDPNYVPPAPEPPAPPEPAPTPSPEPSIAPTPEPAPNPDDRAQPSPSPSAIAPLPAPSPTSPPLTEPIPDVNPSDSTVESPTPTPLPAPPEPLPTPTPSPLAPVVEPLRSPQPAEMPASDTPSDVPTKPARKKPQPKSLSWQERLQQYQERLSRSRSTSPSRPTPAPSSSPVPSPSVVTPELPTPDLPPTLPEIIDAPTPAASGELPTPTE